MKKLRGKILSMVLCLTLFASVTVFSAACDINVHVHEAGEPVKEDVKSATCTEDGSYTEVVYCKDCKAEMSRTPKTEPALGHMPSAPVRENQKGFPYVDGYYTYDEVIYCSDCGAEVTRTEKKEESSDHTPGEEVKENERAATCYALGGYDTVVYCKGCKGELSRVHTEIEKTPHDFDTAVWAKDKTGHWYACKTAECTEKKNFEEHTPGAPATETTSQVCTECGYVIAAPIGHVHADHLTKVDAKEADCTEDGNSEYYACTCGNWYEDDKAQTLIDNHDDVRIHATGHSFESGYASDETNHWHAATCKHTTEKDGVEVHTFGEGVLSGETRVFTCTVCKYEKKIKTHAVVLEYNYSGAPEAITVRIDDGACLTAKPSGFGRDGYAVSGWYTDSACTQKFDTSAPITSDIKLYPTWEAVELTEYVVEAEYIDLTGIKGIGYSNQTQGTGLIQKDEDSVMPDGTVQQKKAGASNGYYLGYMYRRGLTLTFKINSDEATENATLKLALGAEYWESISLSCDEFVVSVNGEKMSFETMVIKGNKAAGYPSEFNDFTVGLGVNLKKGENVITLRVNNNKPMEAAMQATAPLLDCLKVYSDTVITYTPKTSNLDRFQK